MARTPKLSGIVFSWHDEGDGVRSEIEEIFDSLHGERGASLLRVVVCETDYCKENCEHEEASYLDGLEAYGVDC